MGNSVGLNVFDGSLQYYLKLVVLLFADDMVLFAECVKELQDVSKKLLSQWKLKMNPDKTKVVFFVKSLDTKTVLVSMTNL